MLEYNLSDKVLDFSSSLGIWLFVLAVWFLIFGFLGIWFSAMMNRPQKVVKGGIWILVCGILVLNLFMVIAGIMGILIGKKSGSTGGVGSSPIQQTKGSVVLRVLENNSVPGNLQNV